MVSVTFGVLNGIGWTLLLFVIIALGLWFGGIICLCGASGDCKNNISTSSINIDQECSSTDECSLGLVCVQEDNNGYCKVPINGRCIKDVDCIGYIDKYSHCNEKKMCEVNSVL